MIDNNLVRRFIRSKSILASILLICGCASHENYVFEALERNPARLQFVLSKLSQWQIKQDDIAIRNIIAQNWHVLRSTRCGTLLGSHRAKSLIVMFSDHNCRFCQAALKHISESSGFKRGDVAIVVREFPIVAASSRQKAIDALKDAMAGQYQNRYAKEIGVGFAHQDATGLLVNPAVSGKAKEECLDPEIQRNASLAKQLRISVTPTFVTEDVVIRGWNDKNQTLIKMFD